MAEELKKKGLNLSNKSWRMYNNGTDFFLYLADEKIKMDQIDEGKLISCTKYDIKNGTVTHGTVLVIKSDSGNYPVLHAAKFESVENK